MLLWAGGATRVVVLLDDPWPATKMKLFLHMQVCILHVCIWGHGAEFQLCFFLFAFSSMSSWSSSITFTLAQMGTDGLNLMHLDLSGDLQSLWKLFWVTVHYPSLQFVINYPPAATSRVRPVAPKLLNNMCNCSHGNIELPGEVTLGPLTPSLSGTWLLFHPEKGRQTDNYDDGP